MVDFHMCPREVMIAEDKIKVYIDDNPQMTEEDRREVAKDLYEQGIFEEALPLFTEAINLRPSAILYNDRACCYIMLGLYKPAITDCDGALVIDPSNVEAIIRKAVCYRYLGDVEAAVKELARAHSLEPDSFSISQNRQIVEDLRKLIAEGDNAFAANDYGTCISYMIEAEYLAPGCHRLKMLEAECYVYLGNITKARNIAISFLEADSSCVDAHFINGLTLYYAGNLEKALQHFHLATRLDPDHTKTVRVSKKCKSLVEQKQRGNDLFVKKSFREALYVYSDALKIDPTNKLVNAKLHNNRALCLVELTRFSDALGDFNKVISLDKNYVGVYTRRAKCYMELKMYKEAVRDLEHAYEKEKSGEIKRLLKHAISMLNAPKSDKKDYYKILGITKAATMDEIKIAYKKAALIHHPDRHSDASKTERRCQERKFKEVGEAYEILSDEKKRSRYDRSILRDGDNNASHNFKKHPYSNSSF